MRTAQHQFDLRQRECNECLPPPPSLPKRRELEKHNLPKIQTFTIWSMAILRWMQKAKIALHRWLRRWNSRKICALLRTVRPAREKKEWARKSPKKLWVRSCETSTRVPFLGETYTQCTHSDYGHCERSAYVCVCVCLGLNRNNERNNRSICPSLIFFERFFFHPHNVWRSFVFPSELRSDEPKHWEWRMCALCVCVCRALHSIIASAIFDYKTTCLVVMRC